MKNTNSTKDNTKQIQVSFAALNPFIETNIVSPEEKAVSGKDFIQWGDNNLYPNYLCGLYKDVTVLRTIINGIADYVVGDGVSTSLNYTPEEIEDIVRLLAQDYALYGGIALDVERSIEDKVAKAYHLDFKSLRSDKKGDFFYYSSDWKKSAGRVNYTTYSKFRTDGKEKSSIYYFKNTANQTYPTPLIAGDGLIAAETIKSISQYHLNSIKNGFSGNYVMNFNNGVPSDAQKEELEEMFYDKFVGENNAGRPMLSFNNGDKQAVTVTKIDSDNFADKYAALRDSSRQTIFTAFRANPNLFGIPTENNGFSNEEYMESFKLFNRTVIRPIQKIICNAFDRVFQTSNSVTIKPFNIDWEDDTQETVVQ